MDPQVITNYGSDHTRLRVFAIAYERRDQIPQRWEQALQGYITGGGYGEPILKRYAIWGLIHKFVEPEQKAEILERFAGMLSRFTPSELERELQYLFQSRDSVTVLDALTAHANDAKFLDRTYGQHTLRTVFQAVDFQKYRAELVQRLDQSETENRAMQQLNQLRDVNTIIAYLQKIKNPTSLGFKEPRDRHQSEYLQRILEQRLCRVLNLPDEESVYQLAREQSRNYYFQTLEMRGVLRNGGSRQPEYLRRIFSANPQIAPIIEKMIRLYEATRNGAADNSGEWWNLGGQLYQQLAIGAKVEKPESDELHRLKYQEIEKVKEEYTSLLDSSNPNPDAVITVFRKKNSLEVRAARFRNQIDAKVFRYETDLARRAGLRIVRKPEIGLILEEAA